MFLLIGQFASGLSECAARTITEPAGIDLDVAVRELRHRSLVEVSALVGPAYDMPAMAREFATQYLAGHLLQTEIVEATEFLRRWPSLVMGAVPEAAEAIARDLRIQALSSSDQTRML